ncbi:MAG: prepilin-type N-terminal cleavage/methylation domain-containing protein [Candidatus Omnitrophica bacterium]|nr:prepilin-type N-terminal cleavage/methylation domain-containing protein [Candidatus Omnitrophota bacterium]
MNKRGFTLIELVMVIVIIAIIVVMIAPFIATMLDSWLFLKTERDMLFSTRLALNRVVREIRQIENVASIATFTATEFEFDEVGSNTINFRQSGSSLLRNSDELCDKLQDPGGLTFTYLDSDGNVTATAANIRMVRVKMILELEDSSITIESSATFRNIT